MRNDTANAALKSLTSGKGGKTYENIMTDALAAYCVKQDIDYKTVTGGREDWFQGTDFRVYGMLDLLTADSGILRMDVTSAFSEKDNMPLVWTPEHPVAEFAGHELKFGIRTGNARQGFDSPVVVIGIDALNNPDPDKNLDIDLIQSSLANHMAKNAGAIITEAGSALAEYTRMTEPNYAAWLQSEDAQEQDLLLPEKNLFRPNYQGLANCATKNPSGQTIKGLRAAKDLATNALLEYPAGTHEFELNRDFAIRASKLESSCQPKTKTAKPGAAINWLKSLNQSVEKFNDREKSDGISK